MCTSKAARREVRAGHEDTIYLPPIGRCYRTGRAGRPISGDLHIYRTKHETWASSIVFEGPIDVTYIVLLNP